MTCSFNQSIQITYRCDLISQRWIYVYGHSQQFRQCYPLCSREEQHELLEKYFTHQQQSHIRTIRRRHRPYLRFRCYNGQENRWNSVVYRCGTLTLTTYQWFQLHDCSQSKPIVPLPGKYFSVSKKKKMMSFSGGRKHVN